MVEFQAGELKRWQPDHYPYDAKQADGQCYFAPFCQGTHAGCPDNPAEFSERVGARQRYGPPRFLALCRRRAERRFGPRECKTVDEEEA
jgi:hypothetical protein